MSNQKTIEQKRTEFLHLLQSVTPKVKTKEIIEKFNTILEMYDEAISQSQPSNAVEFAEWICKQGYNSVQILVRPAWSLGFARGEWTSLQLYKLFLIEKQESK